MICDLCETFFCDSEPSSMNLTVPNYEVGMLGSLVIELQICNSCQIALSEAFLFEFEDNFRQALRAVLACYLCL